MYNGCEFCGKVGGHLVGCPDYNEKGYWECEICGQTIYEGEESYEIKDTEQFYCEGCVNFLTRDELLEMLFDRVRM